MTLLLLIIIIVIIIIPAQPVRPRNDVLVRGLWLQVVAVSTIVISSIIICISRSSSSSSSSTSSSMNIIMFVISITVIITISIGITIIVCVIIRFRDLATTSPTIRSNKPLNLKHKFECRPSGKALPLFVICCYGNETSRVFLKL